MTSKELWEKLEKFPKLKTRFEEILQIAQNSTGIELADDAEELLLMQGRQLEKDALEAWGQSQADIKSEQFSKRHKAAHQDVKKK
jgi:hypothetical protein